MGEAFLAHEEVLKSGRTLTVVRADVFAVTAADQKQLVATMLATMICLNPERFG
jgi:acyl-coenzyme A thioesterase PaaI-like protein